jgi:MraZ protein
VVFKTYFVQKSGGDVVSDLELTKDVQDAAAPVMPDMEGVSETERALLEKYSRTFTGTFAHTLDSKGRMVIPLAFRDMLGKTFTVAPEFDFKSIAVYPELAYVRMRESHDRVLQETGNPERKKYLQWLDAYTFRAQECDGQGRVLLPARLRQIILGEDKDVDIMGAGDHLRIAVRVKCEDQLMDFIANIDSVLANM